MDYQSRVSSTSSSSKRIWKYDVAISYNNMEAHWFYKILWNALAKEGFRIGRSLLPKPFEIIEESYIYIVVFSPRYAFSPSCLDKLAVMFECMKAPGHQFLPIFFNVDPSTVKTWLAPFQTLLDQRPNLVIQNSDDQRRVIGKIVAEAKKFLVEETFAMDVQRRAGSSSKEIWPWSCDVFVLNFITEDNRSFVEDLRDALRTDGVVMASHDSIARAPMDKYKLHVLIDCEYRTRCQENKSSFLKIPHEGVPCSITDSVDSVVQIKSHQPHFIRNILEKHIDNILREKRARILRLYYIEAHAREIDKSGEIATVGIGYHRVEKLIEILKLGSKDDVRVVGISGMGGVGKTALAGDVFNKISHRFDSAYFISPPTTAQVYLPSQSILKEAFLG